MSAGSSYRAGRLPFGLALVIAGFLAGCSRKPAAPQPSEAEVRAGQIEEMTKAAFLGDRGKIVELLDAGLPVDSNLGTREKPLTALLLAVAGGNDEAIGALINRGASLDSKFAGYSVRDYLFHTNRDTRHLGRE